MPPRKGKRMEKKGKKRLPKRRKTDDEIREVFKLFDKDGNGTIEASELTEVMYILGQATTEEEVQSMIRSLDKDKNGVLDFEEFKALMEECLKNDEDAQSDLLDAFRIFDGNNDGYVDKAELGTILRKCGKFTRKELDELFALIDENDDGVIDYEEFSKAMCSRII